MNTALKHLTMISLCGSLILHTHNRGNAPGRPASSPTECHHQDALNRGGHSGAAVDLSVVFSARGGLENNRKTTESLLAQTIAPRLELIVTSDNAELLSEIQDVVSSSGCFPRCEFLLQTGKDFAIDRSIAATKATAAVVAFAEDHCFPERNWAEELIAAFASSTNVLAAAPLLLNPNPESAVSRGQFLLNHGVPDRGIGSERFEDCNGLPWHGTAYRTDIFKAETRDGGVELLRAEAFLQERIRLAHPAARFVRCRRTCAHHVNMSRLYPALLLAFHGGRIFAAVRAKQRGWGFLLRIARSLLFPVVAVLKLLRTAHVLRDRSSWLRTLSNFSVASLLAFVHAMGEAVGTCFGIGRSERAYATLEFNRSQYLRPGDRHLLLSTAHAPQDACHQPGTAVEKVF